MTLLTESPGSRAGGPRTGRWFHMLRRSEPGPLPLEIGMTLTRTLAYHVMETAHVLGIEEDVDSGVPHVRYLCRLQRAGTVFDAGPKTLALPAFLERFHDRAGAKVAK